MEKNKKCQKKKFEKIKDSNKQESRLTGKKIFEGTGFVNETKRQKDVKNIGYRHEINQTNILKNITNSKIQVR